MKYFFVTGETSGDSIASVVAEDLYRKDHHAEIYYWGGQAMKKTQGIQLHDIEAFKIMGFSDIIFKLGILIKLFYRCQKDILSTRPDILILVDFPGFNLRLARWAKRHKMEVIYIAPPKTWASRTHRNAILKKYVDQIFVLFPFERIYFEKVGIPVCYHGHPAIDRVINLRPDISIKSKYNLDDRPIFAIVPGSRAQEIQRLLPIMVRMAPLFPQFNWCISLAPGIDKNIIQKITHKKGQAHLTIVEEPLHHLLADSHSALVCSGTAAYEAALLRVPQIVCYRTSWFNYHLAKRLIKIPYISLVNLIAGEQIVIELIQDDFNPDRLHACIQSSIEPENRKALTKAYDTIIDKIGPGGNFSSVATAIFNRAIKLNSSK